MKIHVALSWCIFFCAILTVSNAFSDALRIGDRVYATTYSGKVVVSGNIKILGQSNVNVDWEDCNPSCNSWVERESLWTSESDATEFAKKNQHDSNVSTWTNIALVLGAMAVAGNEMEHHSIQHALEDIGSSNNTRKTKATVGATYKLGDHLSDGGIVFYVDDTGLHGLEAQPNDYNDQDLEYMDAITAGNSYGAGWHLPIKDEWNMLYLQKTVVGGFGANSYWSSTEYDSSHAWYQNFLNGSQDYTDKNYGSRVRAVRSF